ncbi:DUF4292 domain-containing protein [Psychroflexus aestuariivivens]|uniref:DUF4292 domain-containing protein n=1 Tax=Psychroflexus aestuariivivens TaxID=1795040 RepID=UPI000FD8A608|nr:DUF4292 domain-containing protein [Psychroflexus aestuariivivens]
MKMKLFLLILCLSFVGCKSSKQLSESSAKEKSARVVLKNFEKNQSDFKTVNGRMRASYKSEDQSQSISITYRIEKDKAIWMSAKLMGVLPLAKIYITPDRVQYYEKLEGTYFDGDFSLAENFLGIKVNFQNLQNLLIGNAMFELDKKAMLFDENDYVFTQMIENTLAYAAKINADNFKIKSQSLLNTKQESLEINYPRFQEVNGHNFPSVIELKAKKLDEHIQIDIEYKTLTFDEDLTFPFSIPNNYIEIKL